MSEGAPNLHAAVERPRGTDANQKKIEVLGQKLDEIGRGDLKEKYVQVMAIMEKPRAEVTEEERNLIREMISIAGQIQTAIAEEKKAA